MQVSTSTPTRLALLPAALLLLAGPAFAGDDLVLTAQGELRDASTVQPATMPAGHPAVPAQPVAMPAGHPTVPPQAVPVSTTPPAAPAAMPTVPTPAPADASMAAADMGDMADTAEGGDNDAYIYKARGMRDPFLPPAEVRAPEMAAKDIPPLQQHALADFRLVAVVRGGKGAFAMVTTADGKGYTIRNGTRIGPDGGRVRQITKNSVVVEVVQPDEFGELKKSETILALRPEEVVP